LKPVRLPPRARPLVVATLLAAGSAGCETFSPATCDLTAEGNPEVTYTGGTTTSDSAGVYVYTSSPMNAELLYFPGGMHYALVTGLPCAPQLTEPYLSFDRYGTNGGSVSTAAGNEAVILGFDEQAKTLQIASNSCADFWLQVTATVQAAACSP